MAIFTQTGIHDPRSGDLNTPHFRLHGFTEAPVIIQCYVTLRCDLTCPHCLAATHDGGARDMQLSLFDKLCSEASVLGVREMLVTGGEPLKRRNFGEIVDCLKHHDLTWSMNTAACPDSDQQVAIRSYQPDYVAVSLDGPPDVHNAIRGNRHAFDDSLAAIRFFSSLAGTTVCVGTTISTSNLPYFDETFDLVRESGAHRWGVHLLIPEGRAIHRKDLFPATGQMRQLLKSIALKRRHFPVALCDEMGYAGEWESLVRDEAFFCAAGRAMCAVLPDGSVMPCSTLDPKHCEGNLTETTLDEIWCTSFVSQRTPRREGKCARCTDWAICGSGCWLQRQHGTHCFKTLWKIPEPFKVAAGIGVCLGVLEGGNSLYGQTTNEASAGFQILDGGTTRVKPGTTSVVETVKSPLLTKGFYASKAGGYRGVEAMTRTATLKTLRWWKQKQNEDGSWSKERPGTITGLALLCFLTHGETPASKEFGPTVEKAAKYLWSSQSSNGCFPGDPEAHAICTLAIAETYSMTRIIALRPVVEQALEYIMDRQQAGGGWSVGYATNSDWNLLFSTWQIHALHAGRLTGSENPRLTESMKRASDFVQKTTFVDGAFRNSLSPSDRTTIRGDVQAAGVQCLERLGCGNVPEVQAAIHWIMTNVKPVWNEDQAIPDEDMESKPRAWYLQSQAAFWSNDAKFSDWDRRCAIQLIRQQQDDGHWNVSRSRIDAVKGESPVLAEYYVTALNCLTLQTRPQRYLPTLKRESSDRTTAAEIGL